MLKKDVVIVGAGFAGASTAFHLSRSFSGSILLLDKEEVPGFHASGRNASLILQTTLDPEIRRSVALSRLAYAEHPTEIPFAQNGSLLLGSKAQLERLRQPDLIPSEYLEPDEVRRRIPLLEGHHFEAAVWTPGDGVMDISALLQFYLREARARGAELWLDCELQQVQGADPYRLKTSRESLEATFLIDAAGAWATRVARLAGASSFPVNPFKRHLFILDEIEGIDPNWPFVWEQSRDFYFRPESGGLLFSICDEERSSSLEPTVNTDISEALAELVWAEMPALREATQREVWSCFRTKPPDQSFVIGWDPALPRFFWVAGLGGHGVGSSWEVGRLAAARFTEGEESRAAPFSPHRFTRTLGVAGS